MNLQMTFARNDQIGLCGLIQVLPEADKGNIAITDINENFKITGCTVRLFDDLFCYYLSTPEDCKNIFLS